MDKDRWHKLQQLFEDALDQPQALRDAFLVDHCGADEVLLEEARQLVFADQHADQFLNGLADASLPVETDLVGQHVEQFQILSKLGAGGMGVVYKAWDTRLERAVALKFLSGHLSLDAGAKERFLLEARAASKLDHPNICTIYDIAETVQGQLYIAMAYYEGETLAQRLSHSPLSLGEALDVAAQLCSGLSAAHAQGIVHRDVKPANIILTATKQCKIVDFGIAKLPGATLTSTGQRLGTLAYMSPEQLRGESTDERTDVWAVGSVLYEALSGRPAFEGEQPHEVMYAALNTTPKPLHEIAPVVPPALDDIVRHALAPDIHRRYASVAVLGADLRSVAANLQPELRDQVAAAASPAGTAADTAPSAERRQMTVLHCALDSTEMDPERLLEALPAFAQTCSKVVQRFGGHLLTTPGHDVIVYFGYPHLHEDDAQRAVRAALGILEALRPRTVAADVGRTEPVADLRIGIHTGLMLVPERGVWDHTVTGPIAGRTAKIAEQLQRTAAPNTLLISDATLHLVRGFFAVADGEALHLSDGNAQLLAHRILHESGARNRLEALSPGRLTPLVGREQELAALTERWARARDGMGQCVLVSGEPGIGKSRLVQTFSRSVGEDPSAWLVDCYCSPYHQTSALYPIVQLFEQVVLEFGEGDSDETKLLKLEGFLTQYGQDLRQSVPLLAALLSVPVPQRYQLAPMAPERQKQLTLQLLITLLMQRSAQQPVLLIVEDLHWSDATTLELLNQVVEQVPASQLLALFTFRPEFTPPWPQRAHLSHIVVSRLTRGPARQMVSFNAGGKALPIKILDHVLAKTDGVPLFIEELTKTVLESRWLREVDDRYELRDAAPMLEIPATLQDSLGARLDRLGVHKLVAQIGSILGRDFSQRLLRAVWPGDEIGLSQGLVELVNAELLFARGFGDERRYIFKHALIQDAAYQSLLQGKRREYHLHVAEVLEKQFPEVSENEPEVLAHHFEEAGHSERASVYWARAADRALKRSANVEAISHARQGLKALEVLPVGPERIQQELSLQMNLGLGLMANKGYASPDVASAYGRARDLCEQLGNPQQLFPVLFGLWTFHCVRANHRDAASLAETLLELARGSTERGLLVEAHMVNGITAYFMGKFTAARSHFAQGQDCYDADAHRDHAFVFGQDPAMVILSYQAWNEWVLGQPEMALAKSEAAVAHARSLMHPHTLAYALTFAAWTQLNLGNQEQAKRLNDEALAVCSEHALGIFLALATVIDAWIQIAQGAGEDGIAAMRGALDFFTTAGGGLFVPYWQGLLAMALAEQDEHALAEEHLDAAFAAVDRTDEHWCQAELLRLRARTLAMQGAPEHDVTECLIRARTIGEAQDARAWSLRALMDLCRLEHGAAKAVGSCQTLRAELERFPAADTSTDLIEAARLISGSS